MTSIEQSVFTNYPRTSFDYEATKPQIIKNFLYAKKLYPTAAQLIDTLVEAFSEDELYLVGGFPMGVTRYTYGQIPSIPEPRDIDMIVDGTHDNVREKIEQAISNGHYPLSHMTQSTLGAVKRFPFGEDRISIDIRSTQRGRSEHEHKKHICLDAHYYPSNGHYIELTRKVPIERPDIYSHISNELNFNTSMVTLDLKSYCIINLGGLEAIHKEVISGATSALNWINLLYQYRLQQKTQYRILENRDIHEPFEVIPRAGKTVRFGDLEPGYESFLLFQDPKHSEYKLFQNTMQYLQSKGLSYTQGVDIYFKTRESLFKSQQRGISMVI